MKKGHFCFKLLCYTVVARKKGGQMDYRDYDRIQAALGGIGDELRDELKEILNESVADANTKALVDNACTKITKSIDELALLISQAMVASTKRG